METKVILISGKAGSGKDTFATFLDTMLTSTGKRVQILHFADILKFFCKEYYGWDGQKDEKGRGILINVGTHLARANNPDIWVNILIEYYKAFHTEYDVFLIPDCRFPNEIERWQELQVPMASVRMLRDIQITSDETAADISETALDDWLFDYFIENNGTLDALKCAAEAVAFDIENLY